MVWRYRFLTVIVCLLGSLQAQGQEFRPRGGTQQPAEKVQSLPSATPVQNSWSRPGQGDSRDERTEQSLDNPKRAVAAVSQDLLQVYSRTQDVRSESDLTNIARSAAKIVSDASRSEMDREYAASLLAWALNRRGEMRSEQAENLARAGKVESAGKLDRQAADDFATAVRYAPENWRHRHNFAISLAMNGSYPQAIEQLDKAIEANPTYANAWFNRAELHLELGEYESAERDYSAAIELAQDAQFYNSRAHCRFLKDSYDSALNDYRRAVELNGSNAAFATDLGDACQFLGRWEESAKAYKQAVAADVQYSRAYQNAAWLMATCPDETIRNRELAMSAAKKALQISQERSPELVETLAAATAAAGRYREAAELQKEAVQIAGKQPKQEPSQLAEFQQRLELYLAGKAYLQPQPAIELNATNPTRTASTSRR